MHLRDLKNYLTELADNNNRPWFIMNKPRYDILREEFLELVTQVIGVKVWVYKGDTLGRNDLPAVETPRPEEERRPRGPRRDGRPGGDRAGAGRGPRRPVGANVAPADGSDKPAGAARS
eukprot:gene43178-53596_t